MSIYRKPTSQNRTRGRPFARGLAAVAIDQRTGFKLLQKDMVFEPGTNFYVAKEESDGRHNITSDELNYPSPKMQLPERVALRYPSPDTPLALGVVISADQLGLPGFVLTSTVYPSIGAGISAGSSVGTGTSAGAIAAIFTNATNSQYVLVVFQGT